MFVFKYKRTSLTAAWMSVVRSTRGSDDGTGDSEVCFVQQTENQNHSAKNSC